MQNGIDYGVKDAPAVGPPFCFDFRAVITYEQAEINGPDYRGAGGLEVRKGCLLDHRLEFAAYVLTSQCVQAGGLGVAVNGPGINEAAVEGYPHRIYPMEKGLFDFGAFRMVAYGAFSRVTR